MTDEQVREWAQLAFSQSHNTVDRLAMHAKDLIASVRAEAGEEAAKVADAPGEEFLANNTHEGVHCCGVDEDCFAMIAAAIRALVKERKGEE